ncbi:MAG: helix-turn-helix domain-containing protein [Fulvivirga sp.]|uniref:helix-turn-helix domain-containing protein n=1 Tax=Fulvivirga sp. TaxID=1931237 RepID=UPI0032EBEE3B
MLYLGLVQSLVSGLVFLLKKPKHASNYILAFWFLILSYFFLGYIIPEGLYTYTKIGFAPFFMLFGPIFYFYVQSLIKIDFYFKWKYLLHGLPFVLISILRIIYLPHSLNAESFSGEAPYPFIIGILFVFVISILSYWLATLVLVIRHQKNMLNYFSNKSNRHSLTWVLVFMLVVLVSNILFFSVPLFSGLLQNPETANYWFTQFNLAILGYLLLIFGLLQPIIFDSKSNLAKAEQTNDKYYGSGLSPETIEQYAALILKYFETKKPFKTPDYSLQMMIDDLKISRQNLSQTINKHFGKNFYQLVNEYRVNEFKKLLVDPAWKHITLLGLALEAGFNSKSSFNRIFREITGQTPSQYQTEKKTNQTH